MKGSQRPERALFKKTLHQVASKGNEKKKLSASVHSTSAAIVDRRKSQLMLVQARRRARAANTGSFANRQCDRQSSTAPAEDPRPFVRDLALVDLELAQTLADKLSALRPTQFVLVCGNTLISSHVWIGGQADLCVVNAEARFDGWLPVFFSQLILRISTGGRPDLVSL